MGDFNKALLDAFVDAVNNTPSEVPSTVGRAYSAVRGAKHTLTPKKWEDFKKEHADVFNVAEVVARQYEGGSTIEERQIAEVAYKIMATR